MFGRILLVVDSPSSAQDVLAIGQAFATRFGSGLLLLHVVGDSSSWPDYATAEEWITSRAVSLRAEGYAVDILIRSGKVASTLAAAAAEQRVDLIILGRHGRDLESQAPVNDHLDISAWMAARVAVPFLVISPCVNAAAALRCLSDPEHTRRAIAVALDGSELAERALPIAVEIARGLDEHLHLVRVVPPMTPDAPAGATSAIRRMAIQTLFADVHAAHEYLAAVRRTIVGSTPVHVQKRVLIGGAAEKLLEAASPTEVGLLVLTTHARGALARAVMGSVTAALLQEARVPLLIVPPTMHDQSRRQPSMEQSYALADYRAQN
jgi:nucleotide-binding universal stress UspA family protein